MRRIGTAALAAIALLLAVRTPARAQQDPPLQRTPAERETVVQLAYVLGEAHALHRLCAGLSDATWYARMERLEAEEASDEAFRRRLVDSFNAGFATRSAEFPECGPASKAAEHRVAAHGAALARSLAAGGE